MGGTKNSERYRVLLIEDNPSDAELIRENLKLDGDGMFTVVTAGTLKEGIGLARAGGVVAVLDLWLPDSSGIGTLKTFREQCPDIPVVVMTGLDNGEVSVEAIQNGAQDYIVKGSVDGRLLASSVRYASERKNIETQLQWAKRESEAIIDSVPVIIFVLDRDALVRRANKTALDFFGVDFAGIEGKRLGAVMGCPGCEGDPDMCGKGSDCARCPLRIVTEESFRTREPYERVEIEREVKAGGERRRLDFYLSAAPVAFRGRDMVLVSLLDITYRKKAEEKMQKAMASILEAEAMKSNFLAMVSHELRTPLTSIKGFLAFLSGGVAGELNKQQAEFVGLIRNNSERLLTLINDILDMSKMESGTFSIDMRPVNPERFIDAACHDISALAEKKGITIARKIRAPGLIVRADEQRMVQVLTNILSNSIKFSFDNSAIDLTLEERPLDAASVPPWVILPARSPAWAVISVKDCGVGLDEKDITRVFERFYQVSSRDNKVFNGAGLGLNITKNIVAEHGGAVWVESGGKGKGATFTVALPVG